MVYYFTRFKDNEMTIEEQEFTHFFLENLKYPSTYPSNLQYLYNNSSHFSGDPQYGFTLEELNNFINRLFSEKEIFEIQGNIHDNAHLSLVIRDANTLKPAYVKDYYIRIRDVKYNQIYHIIVNRPDTYVLHNIHPPFPTNFIISPRFICKK